MTLTRTQALLLSLLVVLPAWADGGKLDSRVQRRLTQIDRHLERGEKALARGVKTSAERALASADREWANLERQYAGKFDPAHAEVARCRRRTEALRTSLAGDTPDKPDETDQPDEPTKTDKPDKPDQPTSTRRPPRGEMSRARHYLEKFEQRVKSHSGKAFTLRDDENRAMALIRKLKTDFPDDADVEALYQRARKAVIASEGRVFEVTPEMMAYRSMERKLVDQFVTVAKEEWAALQKEIAGKLVEKPFPALDPDDTPLAEVAGKYVVLGDFAYPANEFDNLGSQYVYVGDRARGLYYVDLGGREWIGVYNALRRYRRQISGDLPQKLNWTLVGKIVDYDLLIPQAGEKKTIGATMGWIVEPVALWVPGYTLTRVDRKSELAGRFAGEDRLAEVKGAMYSVNAIPDDVTPVQLLKIYETAIKEKNYELWLKCIDPKRLQTPTALQRAAYHWDLHQHRFKTLIVAVEPVKTEIKQLSGMKMTSDKDFFLTEEDKAKLRKHAAETVERATIWVHSYNERGRQEGMRKPHFLRRYGGQGNRWFIEHYATPF